jgi:hypothetical protein
MLRREGFKVGRDQARRLIRALGLDVCRDNK